MPKLQLFYRNEGQNQRILCAALGLHESVCERVGSGNGENERERKREEELNAPRGWILLFDGHLAVIPF